MSITQYEARFEELFKFSKCLKKTRDEAWKCIHYERGLHVELRDKVPTLKIKEYPKLTSMVRIVEENLNACKGKNKKRIAKKHFNKPTRWRGKPWNKK